MQANSSVPQQPTKSHKAGWFIFIFLLIAVVGLIYVKWWPYYHKSILAIDTHSIGDSILSDLSNTPVS